MSKGKGMFTLHSQIKKETQKNNKQKLMKSHKYQRVRCRMHHQGKRASPTMRIKSGIEYLVHSEELQVRRLYC